MCVIPVVSVHIYINELSVCTQHFYYKMQHVSVV